MNLLEATTTLIDAVKTWAPEDDRKIAQAVKRVEKRVFVLQVRAAKRRKRNRVKAFYHAMGHFGGGCDPQFRRALILCKACNHWIFFGDFCRNAEWTGNGLIISLTCPKCHIVMERNKS